METIILPIHFLVLGVTAWNIIKADHMGLTWVRGTVATLDKKEVAKYHYRVMIGLGLMILTGFIMFWPMRDFLLTRVQFFAKMGFVAALVINAFFIGKLQHVAITKKFSSLTNREKIPFLLSGALSGACWVLATAAGFFILP